MSFLCQRESYTKSFKAFIEATESNQTFDPEYPTAFAIRLSDTIIFPEGGGQPGDTGTVDGLTILNCVRIGPHAWHIVDTEGRDNTSISQVGVEVEVIVNWNRRYDHMRHHSGQHLLSGLLNEAMSWPTVSWKLTSRGYSYIDLGVDSTVITTQDLDDLQDLANLCIERDYILQIKLVDEDQVEKEGIRTRGLPEDVVFPLRCTKLNVPIPTTLKENEMTFPLKNENFDPLDVSLCCGTHIQSMGELQGLIISHDFERVKKGITRIYFAVGKRILDLATRGDRVNTALKPLLMAPPGPAQVVAVTRLNTNVDELRSSIKILQDDLVEAYAQAIQTTRSLALKSGSFPEALITFSAPRLGKEDLMQLAHALGCVDTIKSYAGVDLNTRKTRSLRCLFIGEEVKAIFIGGISGSDDRLSNLLSKYNAKGSLHDDAICQVSIEGDFNVQAFLNEFSTLYDADATEGPLPDFKEFEASIKGLKGAAICSILAEFLRTNPGLSLKDIESMMIDADAVRMIERIACNGKAAMKGYKPEFFKPGKPIIFR